MSDSSNAGTGGGCLGGVIAFIISYALNSSFWWAVLAGLCSWFYVLYAVVVRGKEIIPAVRALFGG